MEKVEQFEIGKDTIEDWLDGFEARLAALEIKNEQKKIRWCKAVIGSAGRGILKNTDGGWDQVKAELRRFLGEEDGRTAAWRNLRQYRAGTKTLGEVAADVLGFARGAADEEDVQQRLAVETFLGAIPWKIAKELKRKKLTTLKAALEKGKLIEAMINEEEEKEWSRMAEVHKLETENNEWHEIGAGKTSWHYGEQKRNAGAANVNKGGWETHRMNEGNWNNNAGTKPNRWSQNGRTFSCWACGEPGHLARTCPLWNEWKEHRRAQYRNGNVPQGQRTEKVALNC